MVTVTLVVTWLVLGLLVMHVVGRAARIADLMERDPRAVEIPDGVLVLDEDGSVHPTVPDPAPERDELPSGGDRVGPGQ
jgi:hypothetical protein